MNSRVHFLFLILCLFAVFISCKKNIEVRTRFSELGSDEAKIYFTCETEISPDKYTVDEVGVIWGVSPDLASTGARKECGYNEIFTGTINGEYDKTYYLQTYVNIDGKEYLGEVTSVYTGAVPPAWHPTPAEPAEICTEIAVSPSGIIHVFGQYGRQYYSSDEGSSWTKVNHINTNNLSEPKFIDENVAYVWANDVIRKSTNGGLNWSQITSPSTLGIGAVFFYDSNIIFCAISDTIFRSDNSGITWIGTEISTLESSPIVSDLHFINSNIGYAITYNGEVVKTSDGGANWILLTLAEINPIEQGKHLWFVNETKGVAGVSQIVYYSGDGGVNWDFKHSGVSNPVTEIDFCDESNGIVVLGGGQLVRTTNGGILWTLEEFPGSIGNHLTDVDIVSSTKAYVMNFVGVVYIYE